MKFINEQNDFALLCRDIRENGFQALFEFSSIMRIVGPVSILFLKCVGTLFLN
jgi:hypothetical protein